jgi:hypothetical protein
MVVEAISIRDAMIMASDRGYHNFIFQSDAQTVVKLWEEDWGGRSEISAILQEIKELGGLFSTP